MKIHKPPFEFKSDEAKQEWKKGLVKNEGSYSVYLFANEWAKRMEPRIAAGEKITDIAEPIGREASDGLRYSISNSMYCAAVHILSKYWVHGEELLRWHLLNTRIVDEARKG